MVRNLISIETTISNIFLILGDPNIVGRDGSVPLMVCLVPLINKDPLHHFTHTMKVSLNAFKIFLSD